MNKLISNFVYILFFAAFIYISYEAYYYKSKYLNDETYLQIKDKNKYLYEISSFEFRENHKFENSINLFFTLNDCAKCVEDELAHMESMVGKLKTNVIVKYHGQKTKYQAYDRLYKRLNFMEAKNLDSSLMEKLEKISPVIFYVDSSNKIVNSSIALTGMPEYSKVLYDYVYNR